MFNVVLVHPEIPQNAGNVARLCALTGCSLHLVAPLGFHLTDRHLRRAGVDYWESVDVTLHESLDAFLDAARTSGSSLWLTTTRAGGRLYCEADIRPRDFIAFGGESKGLPAGLLASSDPARCLRIPMLPGLRSLNLANSVAVVVYDSLRRLSFPGLR